MSYRNSLRMSVSGLAIAAIWLLALPVNTAHAQTKITCIDYPNTGCTVCSDGCSDGYSCEAVSCPGSPTTSGCSRCYYAKMQPSSHKKGTVQHDNDDRVFLAQLTLKDRELEHALKSLK